MTHVGALSEVERGQALKIFKNIKHQQAYMELVPTTNTDAVWNSEARPRGVPRLDGLFARYPTDASDQLKELLGGTLNRQPHGDDGRHRWDIVDVQKAPWFDEEELGPMATDAELLDVIRPRQRKLLRMSQLDQMSRVLEGEDDYEIRTTSTECIEVVTQLSCFRIEKHTVNLCEWYRGPVQQCQWRSGPVHEWITFLELLRANRLVIDSLDHE